jgi:uncharacterized protein (DUF305 family)
MTDRMSELFRLLSFCLDTERIHAAEKDYNSQDAKFMRQMIPHHEMAVGMASKQIKKGKNDAAIALASNIKSAQESELETMRAWLKDRNLSEDGDGEGM